ncbi:MAG: hypothetical protein IPL65_22090 [Lewinellaceae bacterium]|nr:hypothetical protein [Lewinellaceae bacterium]
MKLSLNALFLFVFLTLIPQIGKAQDPSKNSLAPCGTAPFTDPWLEHYLQRPGDFAASRSSDTIYAGMQIHLLRRNNGTGGIPAERLLDAFCRLNQDYADAGVQFYFKYDWNYIDSTAWFAHDDILDGISMMFANDVPDALNIYFVSDPAGNCGYNIPYAGIAMGNGCSGPNDHTWAHEVGHALTLQHTFIGWEGKIYNFNNPTPDTLTYDYTHFHAQPDTIAPAPLDTALVERLDGSNCTLAADKFCDTPPDYLSYRWDCDGQGYSLTKLKDANGNEFYADGSFFMSYANDLCSNRFSAEQIGALRNNLLSTKQSWLSPGPTAPLIDGVSQPLMPVGGTLAPAAGTSFHWSPVPGATHYLVQASRFSSFSLKEIETVTTDTSFLGGQLSPNKTYYWRVRAFNNTFTCTNFSPSGIFKTDDGMSSSTGAPDTDGFRCYPNLLRSGQPVTLELPDSWLNETIVCRLYDPLGRLCLQESRVFRDKTNIVDWMKNIEHGGIHRMVLQKGAASKIIALALIEP